MNLNIITGIIFLILAPLIGGLIAGADRIVTARMQGRVGPPLLQPFYDVSKLFEKETMVVTTTQYVYVVAYIVFIAFTGALFFSGGDILLVVFALTLAHVFLIMGAYASRSPYSVIGAERELIMLMAFEPAIILCAAGMYLVSKSFFVRDIISYNGAIILLIPGLFFAFLYVFTMKLRKSPFDISTSHHAHQELIKGLTTDFSGSVLGITEIAHWYETVFLLGFIYLFFAFNPVIGIIALIVIYLLEIYIDNVSARVRWSFALKSAWIITAVLGIVNIGILFFRWW